MFALTGQPGEGTTMKIATILFPTDFSVPSEAALQVATALAQESGARLVITHVKNDDLPTRASGGSISVPSDVDETSLTRMLDEIHPTGDVQHKHVLLSGDPAEEILRLAERERADLIVMSTHGRTGLSRMLMGSVAEDVVRRAPCPVLTLKQPWTSLEKE
jgi:nucleotide-binding universal stress UspA family protein